MAMATSLLKEFVEKHKNDTILVTCDNEHKFWHNAKENPPIIWDWDNEVFIALETNNEIIDQYGNPFTITKVSFGEIQFMTASIDIVQALEFANQITDPKQKEETMKLIQKCAGCTMGPNTLRAKNPNDVR